MNSFSQTYKELAIPYFKEVFDIVDEVMKELEIPYYLIGASAIALELLKENIKPARGTKDIDFAIMISSIAKFEQVVDLLEQRAFNRVEAPWTLYHPDYKVVIDILPFGEIEENSTVNFSERYTDLHVLGLKEVLQTPSTVNIEEKIVRIPALAGMILLKLVAWSDRPEERDNDLYDILRIIDHYFTLEYNEIVEFHHDIFPEDGFDQLKIAARVLGRKAQTFLSASEKLSQRIQQILHRNISDPAHSDIAKRWVRGRDWEITYAIQLLTEFKEGITES